MKIKLYALQDFLISFNSWLKFKKSISECSDDWTYEQGKKENKLYEIMLSYWNAFNGK